MLKNDVIRVMQRDMPKLAKLAEDGSPSALTCVGEDGEESFAVFVVPGGLSAAFKGLLTILMGAPDVTLDKGVPAETN